MTIDKSDIVTDFDGRTAKVKIRVRYPDTDKMGVVYHAKYLEYLDAARTEFMRNIGFTYKELEDAGIGLVVVDVNMKFRMSAFYDDIICVECTIEQVESATVTFGYKVFSDDKLLIVAKVKLISADLVKKTAVRIPTKILAALTKHKFNS